MDIGCQLPMQGPVATRDALVTFARQAEAHGMASLWVSDHVVFPYTSSGYPGGRFPHPPIWGGGDRAGAFRRVVELGDGWHASGKTPAEMRDRIARLRAAADAAKRPWSSITISLRLALTDDLVRQGAQAVTDLFGEYQRIGLAHLMVDFRRDDLGRMLELLDLVATKVRPAVAA